LQRQIGDGERGLRPPFLLLRRALHRPVQRQLRKLVDCDADVAPGLLGSCKQRMSATENLLQELAIDRHILKDLLIRAERCDARMIGQNSEFQSSQIEYAAAESDRLGILLPLWPLSIRNPQPSIGQQDGQLEPLLHWHALILDPIKQEGSTDADIVQRL